MNWQRSPEKSLTVAITKAVRERLDRLQRERGSGLAERPGGTARWRQPRASKTPGM